MNNPIVYKNDFDFEVGRAITLKEGSDIAIIASGPSVYNSLKAAKMLEEEGLSVKVVDMHTIKPLDKQAVLDCCSAKLLVTVEEHTTIGGLGSAVAESLALVKDKPLQLIIGTEDHYIKPGEYNYLVEQYGLSPIQIKDKIRSVYNNI